METNGEGLVYCPEGDAITLRGGSEWRNRPLYCDSRQTVIWVGEMPAVDGPMGEFRAAFRRGGLELPLHEFGERFARYRPGRMEWELSDPRLPGLAARMSATTLAAGSGFALRLAVEGALPGDEVLATLRSPWTLDGSDPASACAQGAGFAFRRGPRTGEGPKRAERSAGRVVPEPAAWEAVPATAGDRGGLRARLRLTAGRPFFIAWASDEEDAGVIRPMDDRDVAEPPDLFLGALARAESLGKQVEANTPDPWLDAAVGASAAAVRGLFVEPCFVHGGSLWRIRQPGWRMMGGATAYGWHDLVQRAVSYWGSRQVKEERGLKFVPSPNGCQQALESRFCGKGFIDYLGEYYTVPHYEFQTLFFDEAVRDWRATGDEAAARTLLPMLELHLERCMECFDPDGDGLYESYNNTWPSDSVWFDGGGSPEESAYVYYGRMAAAEMRRALGDAEAAEAHFAEAAKIREAVDRLLWMPGRGRFAARLEQGGERELRPDAWVYAQHVPLESGLTDAARSWQAMRYTKWEMERLLFPFGGEMRYSTNFVPGMWSVRELYHGDNFAMALGHFLGGMNDEGWDIFRGTMLETMYHDPKAKAGYSREDGSFGRPNIRSPGGLSHPNCGIDFNDITTMFARALVEGLFGWRPDYPKCLVTIAPSFPWDWDRASIATPDFSLSYRRANDAENYRAKLRRPARMRFNIPVRAERVLYALVDGKAARFSISPWLEYAMLSLDLEEGGSAEIVIAVEGRRERPSETRLAREVGDAFDCPLPAVEILDPQGVLVDGRIGPKTAGHHLLLALRGGDLPYYLPLDLEVLDSRAEARRAEKNLAMAPSGADWEHLDLASVLNCDVRDIFRQDYASPRPETASMRLGRDGWSAWTFAHWGIGTPEIGLEAPRPGGSFVTAQGAAFRLPEGKLNIAFASRWDNWPSIIDFRVGRSAEAIWLLVCGSTNPMQLGFPNAAFRFRYEDGVEESLELVPPRNFWSLCGFGRTDYDYRRDGWVLPPSPPPQVSLGENCRAMVYGWRLRAGVRLESFRLEALAHDIVIGLMAASLMNPG
jgi:hypothetical protein